MWVTTEARLRLPDCAGRGGLCRLHCQAGALPPSDLGDSLVWAPSRAPLSGEMRPQRGVKRFHPLSHRK